MIKGPFLLSRCCLYIFDILYSQKGQKALSIKDSLNCDVCLFFLSFALNSKNFFNSDYKLTVEKLWVKLTTFYVSKSRSIMLVPHANDVFGKDCFIVEGCSCNNEAQILCPF